MKDEKRRGGKLAVVLGALTAAAAAGVAIGAALVHRKKENIHISEADLADTLPAEGEELAGHEEEPDDVCGCFEEECPECSAEEGAVTPEEEEEICQPEE